MTEPTTLSPALLLAVENYTKALDERTRALIAEAFAAATERQGYEQR